MRNEFDFWGDWSDKELCSYVNDWNRKSAIESHERVVKSIKHALLKVDPNPNPSILLRWKEAVYLGTRQSAWTDDSYIAIPYEGTMTETTWLRLGKVWGYHSKNRSQTIAFDPHAKMIMIRDLYSIGD